MTLNTTHAIYHIRISSSFVEEVFCVQRKNMWRNRKEKFKGNLMTCEFWYVWTCMVYEISDWESKKYFALFENSFNSETLNVWYQLHLFALLIIIIQCHRHENLNCFMLTIIFCIKLTFMRSCCQLQFRVVCGSNDLRIVRHNGGGITAWNKTQRNHVERNRGAIRDRRVTISSH